MTTFWKDRPTFVTGATGLVGGWLVRRLLEAQADVICLIRDWVPQSHLLSSDLVENITTVRGHVTDQHLLERVLGEYEIDTVIHLAAQTIVSIANRNPVSTFEANIRGTWALLEACRRSPTVRQIIVASSDKAYGAHAELPYVEEHALAGRHPYDVSKSCTDLIAVAYSKTYQLPIVVSRCGNFFGGGDLNWNRVIPGTIRSILRGQRPVIRSDGQYTRDFFYVEDGAAAYLTLAERLASAPELRGEAFNFSSERPATVLQIVQKILSLMGSPLEPDIRNEARNEIRHQVLSSAKARSKLGWKPLFTFDEGLKKTISWYENFLNAETR